MITARITIELEGRTKEDLAEIGRMHELLQSRPDQPAFSVPLGPWLASPVRAMSMRMPTLDFREQKVNSQIEFLALVSKQKDEKQP